MSDDTFNEMTDEIQALRAENERLTAKLEMMGQLHDQDTADYNELDAENERLRGALRRVRGYVPPFVAAGIIDAALHPQEGNDDSRWRHVVKGYADRVDHHMKQPEDFTFRLWCWVHFMRHKWGEPWDPGGGRTWHTCGRCGVKRVHRIYDADTAP